MKKAIALFCLIVLASCRASNPHEETIYPPDSGMQALDKAEPIRLDMLTSFPLV